MTDTNIVILIDHQNGFARKGLSAKQGGSLYVPEGERAGALAGDLIHRSSNTLFVLSQDFHPANHISFAASLPGAALYSEVLLKPDRQGIYHVAPDGKDGLKQKLWPTHAVQNTESALFVDEIMAELPEGLAQALRQHVKNPALMGTDERGNCFFVIRKGMRSDMDSYGIATENDGHTLTAAPHIFSYIAEVLTRAGASKANILFGGLATNYCVEFSHRDIHAHFVPQLKSRGIETSVLFWEDGSRGVPLSTPDGSWPDLKATYPRMAAWGTQCATKEDIERCTRPRGQLLFAQAFWPRTA